MGGADQPGWCRRETPPAHLRWTRVVGCPLQLGYLQGRVPKDGAGLARNVLAWGFVVTSRPTGQFSVFS